MDKCIPISEVTEESLEETKAIRKFKAQATKGLLHCKIKYESLIYFVFILAV